MNMDLYNVATLPDVFLNQERVISQKKKNNSSIRKDIDMSILSISQ